MNGVCTVVWTLGWVFFFLFCRGQVRQVVLRHIGMSLEWSYGVVPEKNAVQSLRRLLKWYFHGYHLPDGVMSQLMTAATQDALEERLLCIDSTSVVVDRDTVRGLRSVQKERYQKVSLPHGYRELRDDDTLPCTAAEGDASCG